jgi:hypothetical protein
VAPFRRTGDAPRPECIKSAMAEKTFTPLSVEHQRHRARFLKQEPIILTDDEQRRIAAHNEAHNEWMRQCYTAGPSSDNE